MVVTGANLVSSTSLTAVISVNTPPANPSSLVINGDGTVDVLFYGIPGRSYQIQRSPNLIDWTVQQTIVAAADGTLPYHDPTPPEDAAFYRTRETP